MSQAPRMKLRIEMVAVERPGFCMISPLVVSLIRRETLSISL